MTTFNIALAEECLSDLRHRLRSTRWPDQLDEVGWSYGTDTSYLKELCAYWAEDFDWRPQEAELNRLEHHKVQVDGLGIHYAIAKGEGPAPIPLLMLHGWPSTFVQFTKIIHLLTSGTPSFTVIAASLPGYGFSDKPASPGWSPARIATTMHRLMSGCLGFRRYAVRSSDLGAGIAAQMVQQQPEAIIGSHIGGTNPWDQSVPADLTAEEQRFVADAQSWNQQEMAYAQLHSTKPQTLAVALNDSPAGLAAWIVEKYRRWGDTGGDVERRFSKDDLLTTATIYWCTQTIGSSMRLYFEAARDPVKYGPSKVPVAMLMSDKDMFRTPRNWVERQGQVSRWTEIDRGGHFLEFEEPELVASDVREFFGSLV